MSQQNIDFGSFPDDPSADAIRTAFNKVQNNFDQLFGANANTTVTSINRTPGAGITVNYPTGNVVVSANIACVQVSTSSLSIGRGSNGFSNALITSSSQTLVVDIDPDQVYSNYFADVNNGLSVFNGNLSSNSNYQSNITRVGTLVSLIVSGNANFSGSNTYISSVANLRIPGGSAGYGLVTDGTGNLSWSAAVTGNSTPGGLPTYVQFQGTDANTGKFAGNAGFTFLAGNGLLSAPSLAIAQDATAANFIGPLTNGNSNITITSNSDITFTSNSNSTMIITATGANITGTANISGNANVGNIGATQAIITTSANIPIIQQGNSNITITNGGNITVYANGNSTARFTISNDGITTNGASNVSGALTVGGNISTYGSNGKLQANNITATGAATGNANVSTVTGDLGLRTIASTYTDNSAAASATIANAAIHAIAQPTLAAANATVTFTNAAALYIANAPAAGANATITNPYSLFVANGSTYFGGANMYVAGNLIVAGNATYYNITSFVVQDPIISLGGGPNGNALTSNDGKDRGAALQYFTTTPVTAFMGWDNSNGEFAFGSNVSIASEVVTFTTLGNVRGLTWAGNVEGAFANFTGNITTTGNADLGNTATANYFVGRLYGTANVATLANTVTTNAQPNITSVGTLTSLAVTANTTSNNFIGKLANGNSNISITADSNIAFNAVGVGIANITGTGINVAGTGNFTGNLAAAAHYGPLANGNSNVQIASANGSITLTAVGNTIMTITGTGANIAGTANVTGNLSTGNINGGNLVTANFISGDGYLLSNLTISAGSSIVSGNSNVSVSANGNVTMYVAGNTTARLTATSTGIVANGTMSVSGNLSAGNINGAAQILATANITAPQLISNVASGTAPFVVTSTTQVANLSVATAGTATSATTAGTVTTAAQPNITSVGTLSSLGVSGAVTASTLVSNVATGTAPLTVTSTTQVANLSVATAGTATSATTAGTVTTNAQPNITSVGTLTSLAVTGNITNGNLTGGNLVSASYLTGTLTTAAQPNITSLGTLLNTSMGSSNSLSGGNLVSASYLTGTLTTAAQPNITSTGTLTGLGVNGTITAVNITANSGVFSGNGASLTSLPGANVTGTVPNANVSIYGAVTQQTTGTYYPVMVNGNTTANYAHAVTPGISFNIATNTVSATAFAGNLTATGTVQAANVISTAFIQRAVTTGVSANGSTQAQATALTTEINIVSAVGSGTGVRLPAAIAGTVVYITNSTANSLVVYPQTSGQINNLGANIGFSQGANSTLQFMAPTTTQWYTIGATWA